MPGRLRRLPVTSITPVTPEVSLARTHRVFASGQHPFGTQGVPAKVIGVTKVTGYYADNLQKRSRQHRTFRPRPETLTEKESCGTLRTAS